MSIAGTDPDVNSGVIVPTAKELQAAAFVKTFFEHDPSELTNKSVFGAQKRAVTGSFKEVVHPPCRSFCTDRHGVTRQFEGPPLPELPPPKGLMFPLDRARVELAEQAEAEQAECVDECYVGDDDVESKKLRTVREDLVTEGEPGWRIPDPAKMLADERSVGDGPDPRAAPAAVAEGILKNMMNQSEADALASISSFWTDPLKTHERFQKTLTKVDRGEIPMVRVPATELHGTKYPWGMDLPEQREANERSYTQEKEEEEK